MWYVVVIFFFFKQKTAYEMRISDWSSDVCSSDLDGRQIAIDLEVTRAQIWFEGKIADRDAPGFETKLYTSTAPRHSNLPPRLKPGGAQSQDVSLVTFSNAEVLAEVLAEYGSNRLSINRANIALL